eukprot:CAMPEP_0206039308 /NCGR_PEP_ID=MMETSP1466-20131121/4671_1 /ASSEMBLY_ACC=CAM_ASM_001126 /TAXON_ID=44452 /ORGANISM="Pavlova gyrans, Strain CCMP608" /LENGTH=185 /DNA_ID=CAMNT_0053413941 /DNA_START=21 /DNA_END=581 /DNA_ORIENTATION=-
MQGVGQSQLPKANMDRLVALSLPCGTKTSAEAKDLIRTLAAEWICFLVAEADDTCKDELLQACVASLLAPAYEVDHILFLTSVQETLKALISSEDIHTCFENIRLLDMAPPRTSPSNDVNGNVSQRFDLQMHLFYTYDCTSKLMTGRANSWQMVHWIDCDAAVPRPSRESVAELPDAGSVELTAV